MKKIVFLMIFSFFAISLLTIEKATAQDIGTLNNSNVYSTLVSEEEIVTLDNGESYEIIKTFPFFKPELAGFFPVASLSVNTIDTYYETFSIEIFSPTTDKLPRQYAFGYTNLLGVGTDSDWAYTPTPLELHDVVFRVTNYSAGPATFNISANIEYMHP